MAYRVGARETANPKSKGNTMFQAIPAPTDVVAVQLSGKLSAQDVRDYQALLDAHIEQHRQTRPLALLVDISELEDLGPGALASGTRADLDFVRHSHHFARLALVTDKHWPDLLWKVAAVFLPHVQMRRFAASERAAALAWASEPLASLEQALVASPALRILPSSSDSLLAFEINGAVTRSSVASVLPAMRSMLDRHEKIDVLAHFKHFGGIEPALYLQPGLMSMKVHAIPKVRRYALVAAPSWMNTLIRTLQPLFSSMEMRSFAEAELGEAWEWLGARQV